MVVTKTFYKMRHTTIKYWRWVYLFRPPIFQAIHQSYIYIYRILATIVLLNRFLHRTFRYKGMLYFQYKQLNYIFFSTHLRVLPLYSIDPKIESYPSITDICISVYLLSLYKHPTITQVNIKQLFSYWSNIFLLIYHAYFIYTYVNSLYTDLHYESSHYPIVFLLPTLVPI